MSDSEFEICPDLSGLFTEAEMSEIIGVTVDINGDPFENIESGEENWADDLTDTGNANFVASDGRHVPNDPECLHCRIREFGNDSEDEVIPITPSSRCENDFTPLSAENLILHESSRVSAVQTTPPATLSQNRTSAPRARHRRPLTRRQRRRANFDSARAAAQTWGDPYLYDPTAREFTELTGDFGPGDPRDIRDYTVVVAFGESILVPRRDRMRYRQWRRFLPIGRLYLRWDQALRLVQVRLRPNYVPY